MRIKFRFLTVLFGFLFLEACAQKQVVKAPPSASNTVENTSVVTLEQFGFESYYKLLFGKLSVSGDKITRHDGEEYTAKDVGRYICVFSAFKNPKELVYTDISKTAVDWRYFPQATTAKYAKITAIKKNVATVIWEGIDGCQAQNPQVADGYIFAEANDAWNKAIEVATKEGKNLMLQGGNTYVLRIGNKSFGKNMKALNPTHPLKIYSANPKARVKYGWEDYFAVVLPKNAHKKERKELETEHVPIFEIARNHADITIENIDFVPVFSRVRSMRELDIACGTFLSYSWQGEKEGLGDITLLNINQQAEYFELKNKIDTSKYPMQSFQFFVFNGGGKFDFAKDEILAIKTLNILNCTSIRNRYQGGTQYHNLGSGSYLVVKNSQIGTIPGNVKFNIRFKIIDDGRGYRTVQLDPKGDFSAYQMMNQYLAGKGFGLVELHFASDNKSQQRYLVTGSLYNADKKFAIKNGLQFDVVQLLGRNTNENYTKTNAALEVEVAERGKWYNGTIVYDRAHKGLYANDLVQGHAIYQHQHLGFNYNNVIWIGDNYRSNNQDPLNPQNKTTEPKEKVIVNTCFKSGYFSGEENSELCLPEMRAQIAAYAYLKQKGNRYCIFENTIVANMENVNENVSMTGNCGMVSSGVIRAGLRVKASKFYCGIMRVYGDNMDDVIEIDELAYAPADVNRIVIDGKRKLIVRKMSVLTDPKYIQPMQFSGGSIVLKNGFGGVEFKGNLDDYKEIRIENWDFDNVNGVKIHPSKRQLVIPEAWLSNPQKLKQLLKLANCSGSFKTDSGKELSLTDY